EFASFLGADEARERLLEHLVLTEPEQLGNRVICLQDLAFEVGHEHRVRRVRDDDVGLERVARLHAPPRILHCASLRTEFRLSSHVPPYTDRGESVRRQRNTVKRPWLRL